MKKTSVSIFAIVAALGIAACDSTGASGLHASDIQPISIERTQDVADASTSIEDKEFTPIAFDGIKITNEAEDAEEQEAIVVAVPSEEVIEEPLVLEEDIEDELVQVAEEDTLPDAQEDFPIAMAETDTMEAETEITHENLEDMGETIADLEESEEEMMEDVASIEDVDTLIEEAIEEEVAKVEEDAKEEVAELAEEQVASSNQDEDYIPLSAVPDRPALTAAERADQLRKELENDLASAQLLRDDMEDTEIATETETVVADIQPEPETEEVIASVVEETSVVMDTEKIAEPTMAQAIIDEKVEETIEAPAKKAEEKTSLIDQIIAKENARTAQVEQAVQSKVDHQIDDTIATEIKTMEHEGRRVVVAQALSDSSRIDAPRWSKEISEEKADDLLNRLEDEKVLMKQAQRESELSSSASMVSTHVMPVMDASVPSLPVNNIYSVTKAEGDRSVVPATPVTLVSSSSLSTPMTQAQLSDMDMLDPESLALLPGSAVNPNSSRVRREIRAKNANTDLSIQSKERVQSYAMNDANTLMQEGLPTLPTQLDASGKGINASEQLIVEGRQARLGMVELPTLGSVEKAPMSPKYMSPKHMSPNNVSINDSSSVVASVSVAPEQVQPVKATPEQPTQPPQNTLMALPDLGQSYYGATPKQVVQPVPVQQAPVRQAQAPQNNVVQTQTVSIAQPLGQPVSQPMTKKQVVYKPKYYVVPVHVKPVPASTQNAQAVSAPQSLVPNNAEVGHATVAANAPDDRFENLPSYRRPVKRRSSHLFVPARPSASEKEMAQRRVASTADALAKIDLNTGDYNQRIGATVQPADPVPEVKTTY